MHLNPSHAGLFLTRKLRRRWSSLLAMAVYVALIVSLPSDAFAAQTGSINHVVIFWLKRPGNAQDRLRLAQTSEKFRALPGILRVEVGRALPVRRPGIEQPFDLCVIFTFRNQAALDRFEADPRHNEAVKAVLKPLVKRYAIFNAVAD